MSGLITYENSQLIYEIRLKTSNADSVFLYYTLEACSNLCFYSTLDFEEGQLYRNVQVQCTIEMKSYLQEVLKQLKEDISFEVILEREYLDE